MKKHQILVALLLIAIILVPSTAFAYSSWESYTNQAKTDVYSQPGGGQYVGWVDNIDPITVLDESSDYYFIRYITYSGAYKEGYIPKWTVAGKAPVTTAAPTPAPTTPTPAPATPAPYKTWTGYMTSATTDVYSGTGSGSRTGNVSDKYSVTVNGESGDYYFITYLDDSNMLRLGYVLKSSVSSSPSVAPMPATPIPATPVPATPVPSPDSPPVDSDQTSSGTVILQSNANIDQRLLSFIEAWEGFQSTPYKDPSGNATIGIGHLIKIGESFTSITREDAYNLLKNDLSASIKSVNDFVSRNGISLNSNQQNALASLTFNVGNGWQSASLGSLLKANPNSIDSIDKVAICQAFSNWHRGGNRDLVGLYRRRIDESMMFLFGQYSRNDGWALPSGFDTSVVSSGHSAQHTLHDDTVNYIRNKSGSSTSTPAPAPTTSVNYQVKVTTTAGLNVRDGAGTNYALLTAVPYNTVLTITAESGGWGKTTYNGKTGWILLSYTACVDQSSSSGTPKSAILYGDVNGDGKVDQADLSMLRQYLVENIKVLPNHAAADMNQDGSITLTDLSIMRRLVPDPAPPKIKRIDVSSTSVKVNEAVQITTWLEVEGRYSADYIITDTNSKVVAAKNNPMTTTDGFHSIISFIDPGSYYVEVTIKDEYGQSATGKSPKLTVTTNVANPVSYQVKVTTTSGLNLRNGAGTTYGILTAAPYNTVLTITAESESWGKTTYNGKTGWVLLSYTAPVTQAFQEWTGRMLYASTDVYSTPSGAKIGFVDNRDPVTVIGESGNFFKIRYKTNSGGTKDGYVLKSRVEPWANSNSNAGVGLPREIALKQNASNTCTLASAAMMLRAKAYLSGKAYASITEASLRAVAWAPGLYNNFSYGGYSVTNIGITSKSTADKKTYLIQYLNNHPEGIVIYDKGKPHAVHLMAYRGGVFYVNDPYTGQYNIPINTSTMRGSGQDGKIANLTSVWCIK